MFHICTCTCSRVSVPRFANSATVSAYATLLADWRTNSVHTNHCIIKMLHRFAFDRNMPGENGRRRGRGSHWLGRGQIQSPPQGIFVDPKLGLVPERGCSLLYDVRIGNCDVILSK